MLDRSLIGDALDRWEDLRAEGKAISAEQFLARYCAGWTSKDIAEFRKQAAALERVNSQLRAEGFKAVPGTTSAGPDDSVGLWSLRRGVEPVPGYRLRSRLGRGGFGEVWEASAPGGFTVALKFVRLHSAAGEAELKALEVIRAIRHPNLLSVHGAWQQDGFLIIAMDLAERTLLDRFREAAAAGSAGIPADELICYMDDAARGIDFLNRPIHRVAEGLGGIQHRDIKPQNLLLVGGCVRVADFGLSRLLERSVTGHSGSITAHYAAPEFFDHKTSDRSDQYSLAVTYCHLRGGRLPFDGDSLLKVIYAHVHCPPDLSGIPERERTTVARALAKRPEDRWPNCYAFVRALTAVASVGSSSGPVTSVLAPRPSKHAGAAQMLPNTVTTSGKLRPPPLPRRTRFRRWRPVRLIGLFAALGGLALAVAGVGLKLGTAWFPSTARGRLVLIPAGEFMMGSLDSDKLAKNDERPQHLVRITTPFYLGTTEVTLGQFRRFVEATGYRTDADRDGRGDNGWDAGRGRFDVSPRYGWRDPGFLQTEEHPVVNVSWNDAVAFCDYLSRLEGLKPFDHLHARGPAEGPGYRLPTEAEWEYACRAGTLTRYWSGDDPELLAEVENIADGAAKTRYDDWTTIAASDGFVYTAPVSHFKPNKFGLFDMHGNVSEWCWDGFYYEYYSASPETDPLRPLAFGLHVVRGGNWKANPRTARSASHHGVASQGRNIDLGFRVARSKSEH